MARSRPQALPSADDLVDDFGLISRGNDDRLLRNPALQARYFTKLQRKHLAACASAPGVASLRRTLQNLTIDRSSSDLANTAAATTPDYDEEDVKDEAARRMALDQVVLGLRKLREAVLASGPPTPFAKSVFLFTVRVTVPIGHYESYLPAIKYLLDIISQTVPLTLSERHEIGGLYLLHLAHFSNDVPEAFEAMQKYNLSSDLGLRQILRAWCDRDYILWRRRYEAEIDPARRKLMEFGERTMVLETLKRIGAAYFFMQMNQIEELTGWPWERLVSELGCGWRLEDGGVVVIRERRKKTTATPAASQVTTASA